MNFNNVFAFAMGIAVAGPVFGDGSYQKTTQITGGPSISAPLMKLAEAFSPGLKHVTDPNTEIMMVHGNRMVTVTMNGSTIWDIDKGTMTTTDNKKREYSVITLQQMQEMTRKFMSDMSAAKAPLAPAQKTSNPNDMQITTESSPAIVRNTGAEKRFGGVTARETLLTLKVTMKVTDPKSGESAVSESLCYLDVWKADSAPGYDDVQDFYRRLGERMGGNKMESQRVSAAFASRPEAGGMSTLRGQANKIKGITVLEVERVSTLIGGQPLVPSNQANSDSNRQPQNSGNSAAEQTPSIGSILGRSVLGSFGKKKPASSPDSPAQAQADPGVLSETTTQLSNFSTQPVVLSEFEVPAGYREVPSPILQLLK